jgi:hypothetical protein
VNFIITPGFIYYVAELITEYAKYFANLSYETWMLFYLDTTLSPVLGLSYFILRYFILN